MYPTKQQESRLQGALNASSWLYNYLLDRNVQSIEDMQFVLTELKEQESWLKEHHSKMLQMVVHRIHAARKALSALQHKGYRTGKMKRVERDEYNSFTYNQSGFKIEKHGSTDLLWLSKIGYIQIRLHKQVYNIKQITITKKINKWYATICCEIANPLFRFIDPRKSTGIDVGITKFVHDSDNHSIDNPLFMKKMLKPLNRARRRFSRRKEGSKNKEKAKTRLQKLHERINNQRKDFLHKVSTDYSRRYDIIFLERLKVSNISRNHRIARNVLDSSWGTFASMLSYKSKLVVEVEPYNTSIDCSRCGTKVRKSLAIRVHRCSACGLVIDRDYNASLNIKQKGLLQLGLPQELREVTPVEIPKESMKQEQIIVKSINSS